MTKKIKEFTGIKEWNITFKSVCYVALNVLIERTRNFQHKI